jgi:hypothetical protein
MRYSDELGREYTKQEARFWREVKHAIQANRGVASVYPVAQNMGIPKHREQQLVRTWMNDGLVRGLDGGTARLTLTPFGRRFTFEDRYSDIME